MAQNIHLVTTIVAIMAIWKIKYIWILLEHNCCNYGNSETKDTVYSWWHTCCNCGNCGKKKYESRWQQLSQLWQFWKNPGDINCRNYGNFEDKKKIYGSLFITIVAIMAILKTKNIRILFITIAAIMAILKKIQLTPDDSNCCNCGNYGKKQRWIPVTTIVAIMAILKIAKIASLWQSSRLSCNSEI